ncbi:nucleotide kinase [Klebsiella phage Kpn13]|uniref:Nucleotide kinase n=1 Tax=Klebsiella phage Kpn13 TaxID=3044024 RepID=A0AAT9V6B1_9CAUD|nr:nucleotide kinase [Klebsiella phage Kpn13]
MSKFKVGNVVTRLAQYRLPGWKQFCRKLNIPEGSPLIVTDISDGLLILAGCSDYRWTPGHFMLGSPQSTPESTPKAPDAVNSPKHYQFFPDLEAIIVIARSMTQAQFYGYCLGNRLKYRLRAGNKDKLEQDIAKSDKYLELYEKHRGECIDAE